MFRALGVVLVPFLLAAQAGAANLFVDVSGSGTACTQASPCQLSTALAQMGSGDTVYVAGGTYTGSGAQVVLLDRSLTYTLQGGWDGAGGGSVVIDPDANETVLDGQNARRVITITVGNPTIRGFTITRGNATGLTAQCQAPAAGAAGCGGGIFAINSIPVIENNVIVNNVAAAVTPAGTRGFGGGIMIDYNWPVIRENVVRNNTASLDGEGYGGGIAAVHLRHQHDHSRQRDHRQSRVGGRVSAWGAASTRPTARCSSPTTSSRRTRRRPCQAPRAAPASTPTSERPRSIATSSSETWATPPWKSPRSRPAGSRRTGYSPTGRRSRSSWRATAPSSAFSFATTSSRTARAPMCAWRAAPKTGSTSL